MPVTVLAPASTRRLTTLGHLMDELGLDAVQPRAAYFERLIDAVSRAIERFCGGRIFAQQRYLEILPAVNDGHLFLSRVPLVSIGSVTSDGETLLDWRIHNAEAGMLWHPRGWGWGSGLWEWSTTWSPFEWAVTYVAGYILPGQTAIDVTGEALPADIEQAAIEAIKVWDAERFPEKRVASRHFEDQTITYAVQAGKAGLPKLSQQLLLDGSWRRVVIR